MKYATLSDRQRTRPACLALLGVLLAASPAATAAAVGEGSDPVRHLQAFQEIADGNGGNRASGLPGYDRSAEYVADLLKGAGYAVRFEEFSFPFFEERSPPALAYGPSRTPAPQEALRTLANSGAGEVTATLQAVDIGNLEDRVPSTSGCEREDFASFQPGRIALVRRGTCPFQVKVDHAAAAGAVGVIIMNQGTEGQEGAFSGRLSQPAPIPVLGVSTEIGRALDGAAPEGDIRLVINVASGTRSTRNVIADRPAAEEGTVVVGAHLDSVPEGPGINDNASGSAAVLDVALRLADEPLRRPLRFAFWGAEERGLLGSRHHVGALPEEERRRIALYINLDMVGSSNFGRFIQSSPETGEGVAATVRQSLVAFFRDRNAPAEDRARNRRGSGSDDASFAEKGVPTIGLYTGAGEPKGEAQAAQFGGSAGRPYDPCYHRACDTVSNINQEVLGHMTEALLQALRLVAVSGPPAAVEPGVRPGGGG